MNLTRYSIRKNKTITFSENKTKSDNPDLDERLRKMLVGQLVGDTRLVDIKKYRRTLVDDIMSKVSRWLKRIP